MASQTDEIIVKFRTEGGDDVEQHFKRVGEGAENFGRHTGKAGESLDGLRLKSEGRVARNLGEIAKVAASGAEGMDVLAAATFRVAESIKGGLALAAGATVLFSVFEALKKTQEEAIALEREIAHIHSGSFGNATFKSIDQIRENLKGAAAELDKLHQRDTQERNSPFGGFFRRAGNAVLGGGSFSSQEAHEEQQRNQLRRDASAAIDDLAKKTNELNHVEAIRVREGARAAELEKARIDHEERLGELAAAESAAGVQNAAARNAEIRRFENEKALIGYKFSVIDHQIELEGRLTRVQELRSQGGLTAGQAAVASLKLQAEAAADLLRHYQKIGDADKIATQTILADRSRIAAADAEFAQFRKRHILPEDDPSVTRSLQREQHERARFDAVKRDRANHGRDPGGHDTSLHTSGLTTHGLITSGLNSRLSAADWRNQFKQHGLKHGSSDAEFHKQFMPVLSELLRVTKKAWE